MDGLVNVGVDEVSWKKRHHYLTLVTDHGRKKIVWGKAGKDTATLDALFTELGQARAGQNVRTPHSISVSAISLPATAAATLNPQTHPHGCRESLKGARWALLKRPDHLTDDQAGTLRKLRHRGGELWRAYTLREAFRAIFAGDLTNRGTSPSCSTGGSARPAAPASTHSSRPRRPSASTAMGYWPRSG